MFETKVFVIVQDVFRDFLFSPELFPSVIIYYSSVDDIIISEGLISAGRGDTKTLICTE